MTYLLVHKTDKKLSPGKFYPRGASVKKDGVNFAIYSRYASEAYLLLFDTPDGEPTDIIKLEEKTRFVWHVFVHGIKPGQLYGFKVRGRYDPHNGMRFNERKLLLSPYAKAVTGPLRDRDGLLFGYDTKSPYRDLLPDERDNTPLMPKCIVIDDAFDWNGDEPPDIPLEELIIYEVHVKGFTAHPSSGVKNPGTYLGVIDKIPYLKELGINAVEFLPVQQFYVEDFLLNNGLTNYWGYNTIAFFAPEVTYGTGSYPGCQVNEFKTMVKELHKAGIEVILDVVYNHTAEGNELGPTLSFKGIDNGTYYHLTGTGTDPFRYYMNYTGCGNSLRVAEPSVLWLVMDSLRYWVQEMHVDGFRFDLASVLGRGGNGQFEHTASFFDTLMQDPVLSRVKLIAEPWDLHGNHAGGFPVNWSEWNGRFRDAVRMFGKGDPGQAAEMGWRLTGSADMYAMSGRTPANSINFITCHDGFTLYDLVSYNGKHNEANQEMNNDGSNDNYSWNCGWEGETDDPEINTLRRKQVKNYLCYLFLSTGTPMLLGGDEFMRTQRGNNNTYCQDNELSWFDWTLVEKNRDIFEFTKKLIRFTREQRIRQRKKFFQGCWSAGEGKICDIAWYGKNLDDPVWDDPCLRTLCFQFSDVDDPQRRQTPLFIILNADPADQKVRLPEPGTEKHWRRVLDTSLEWGKDFLETGSEEEIADQELYHVAARSTVVLKAVSTL